MSELLVLLLRLRLLLGRRVGNAGEARRTNAGGGGGSGSQPEVQRPRPGAPGYHSHPSSLEADLRYQLSAQGHRDAGQESIKRPGTACAQRPRPACRPCRQPADVNADAPADCSCPVSPSLPVASAHVVVLCEADPA